MFDARRRLATVSLLGTMGATLFVAHWRGLSGHGQGPVLLLLLVLQVVAQVATTTPCRNSELRFARMYPARFKRVCTILIVIL